MSSPTATRVLWLKGEDPLVEEPASDVGDRDDVAEGFLDELDLGVVDHAVRVRSTRRTRHEHHLLTHATRPTQLVDGLNALPNGQQSSPGMTMLAPTFGKFE